MPLLSDQDRQIVQGRLAAISHPVTLLFFTQTIGAPDTAFIAKQILDEVATLSADVTVEDVNFVLDKDRAAQFGVTDIPTVVLLRSGEDTRIRFLGAPAGYEFMSLVDAILLAGTNDHDAVDATGEGRAINRHDYQPDEVEAALGRPVVRRVIDLVRLRNTHPAFDGDLSVASSDGAFTLAWQAGTAELALEVDLAGGCATVTSDGRPDEIAQWRP